MATLALGRGLRTNLSATPGIASTSDIEKSRKAYEPSRQRAQEALQEQSFYQSEVTGAKGAELKAKLDVEQGVREAGAKSLQDYATEEKGLIDTAKAEKEKNPFPTFQPTQEDAMSYGQLGSMVATLGVMLGSGGKASAKVAIGSLTGMMNGWQKGRKDLWEKESKTFEKEVNRIKMIRESITKDLETGLKLAGTNRDASKAALESAAYKAGSGSVIARYLATGRATDALDFAKKSADLDQKIEEQIMSAAARETMHKQTIAEAQRLRETTAANKPAKTPNLVQIRNTKTGDTKTIDANRLTYSDTTGEPILPEGYSIVGKVGSVGKEGGSDQRPKATSVDARNYSALKTQRRGWNRIETLLSDVDFAERFDKLGIKKFLFEPIAGDGFTAYVSKGLSSSIAKSVSENDPQMIAFLQDIIIVRNAYYLQQSGKAVTGGEAARNFFASIQPTDSASVLQQKSKRAKEEISNEMTDLEKALRGLAPQQSEQTNKPISNKTYSVGEIIERNGKKYKVTDISDPSDPDFEEVP
jgi:hypothetical protein